MSSSSAAAKVKESDQMLSVMNLVLGEREKKIEKKRDLKFRSKKKKLLNNVLEDEEKG
jgi:hypothetical protein